MRGLELTRGKAVAAALSAACGVFVLHTFGVLGHPGQVLYDSWLYGGLLSAAVIACFVRATTSPDERAPWLLMTVGMAAWTLGDIYWMVDLSDRPSVPVPSAADGLYLAFYPLAYATLVTLVRRVATLGHRDLWLDGVIGASCAAAVAIAVSLPAFETSGGGTLEIATNLAYPALDVVLLVFVILVFGLSGWRPGRRWTLIGLGLGTMALTDGWYLVQAARGAYVEGTAIDAGWPIASLLVALAAWQPSEITAPPAGTDRRLVLIPVICGVIALAIVSLGVFGDLADKAVMPALICLLLVTARMGVAFLEGQKSMLANQRDALTDGLTGLPNRRALIVDLGRATACASDEQPWICIVLDLDGFKAYNDAFGHPAGDDLLARLGQRLTGVVSSRGTAYRLGGDEFCLLDVCTDEGCAGLLAAARAALSESGEGFDVTSSAGEVYIPRDAREPSDVLQLADRRMYTDKGRRSSSAGHQSRAVLLRILREREPERHSHLVGVAELAVAVGRELGMTGEELDEVARAAELHDVGKIAIPEEILRKPGALDADEWAFVKRHTVIGERILGAAPALRPVARLVRSTHERYDGTGYPDGLRGEEIPLGSRIVAVCDAYEAMVGDRPYRRPLTPDEAVEELRRGAGSQFDPSVVKVFTRALGKRAPEPLTLG
jgi:two-component system, cell cycle response regulator